MQCQIVGWKLGTAWPSLILAHITSHLLEYLWQPTWHREKSNFTRGQCYIEAQTQGWPANLKMKWAAFMCISQTSDFTKQWQALGWFRLEVGLKMLPQSLAAYLYDYFCQSVLKAPQFRVSFLDKIHFYLVLCREGIHWEKTSPLGIVSEFSKPLQWHRLNLLQTNLSNEILFESNFMKTSIMSV